MSAIIRHRIRNKAELAKFQKAGATFEINSWGNMSRNLRPNKYRSILGYGTDNYSTEDGGWVPAAYPEHCVGKLAVRAVIA